MPIQFGEPPGRRLPRITMAEAVRAAVEKTELPDVADLEDVGRQARELDRLREQVPGLGELLDEAAAVTADRGGVVVEGCPFGDSGADALVALMSARFGGVDPKGNGFPSRLVFDVAPRKDGQGNVSMSGTSTGAGAFSLHNDSANFEEPHTHVVLACVRSEQGQGGESLVVRADALAEELQRRGDDANLKLLSDPVFPFLAGVPHPDDIVAGPVLYQTGERWEVRYSEQFVKGGLRVHALDAAHAEALECFEELLDTPGLTERFTLRPGDFWVLENRRWLHGRREIDTRADRLLKRCKVYSRG
jgi:hypothetical protein